MPSKYTEEFVRSELAKEGWELLSEYQNSGSFLLLRNPDFLDGAICKQTFSGWQSGYRPNLDSLENKKATLSEQVKKDGWFLLDVVVKGKTKIIVNNPERFDGSPLIMSWSKWAMGQRPRFTSLIDKTGYVKHVYAGEGWFTRDDFVFQSAKSDVWLSNPHVCEGHWCRLTWDMWNSGIRPRMRSLVNPSEYVTYILGKTGWKLSRPFEGFAQPIFIENSDILNGNECKFTFGKFLSGVKPDIRSLTNPEKYIKEYLYELGYLIEDENFVYNGDKQRFSVQHLKSGRISRASWAHINSGQLAGMPKVVIRSRINRFLSSGKRFKKYSVTKLFPESYWNELEEAFPYIKPGLELDHIIPISWFDDTWEQMRIANNVKNLRLLTKAENMRRRNYLRSSELDEYDLWNLYYLAENPKGYKLIEDRYELVS